MADTTHIHLTDAELTELDTFLLSDACEEETFSIDEAHGYLTALLITAPDTTIDEWSSTIWGSPNFTSAEHEQHHRRLLARLYEDVRHSLESNQPFEPLVVEVEEDDGVILEAHEGWCYGFIYCVEQYPDHWGQLNKDGESLLAPIAQLALLDSDEEPEMEEEDYNLWVELLPGAVMGLRDYFQHH